MWRIAKLQSTFRACDVRMMQGVCPTWFWSALPCHSAFVHSTAILKRVGSFCIGIASVHWQRTKMLTSFQEQSLRAVQNN